MICKFKYFDLIEKIMINFRIDKNQSLINYLNMLKIGINLHKMLIRYFLVPIEQSVIIEVKIMLIDSVYIDMKETMSNLTDTINRLISLGIIGIDDNRIVFTKRYIEHLNSICHMLKHASSIYDNPYALLVDGNAYALASWIGSIRESEFIELLNAIIHVWGEALYG